MSQVGRWVFAIVSGLALVASVYLRMEALAVVALLTLGIAVLRSEMFQGLAERLRKAGPLEFDPVRRALEAIPERERPKAEEEARETMERLGKDMFNVNRFANSVRAELAAPSVRMTAVELTLNALRSQITHMRQHLPSPPTRE